MPPPGDFDTIMRLLARYQRPPPNKRPDWAVPRPVPSHAELIELLGERLEKRWPRPPPDGDG